MTFVLVETLSSKRQGRTIWFAQMTDIGPATTADPEQRAEFETEDEARQCPAMWHALSFFEVQPLQEENVPAEPSNPSASRKRPER